MKSEIFIQPELEELITDNDSRDEWMKQVEELGLEGQISLTENSPKKSASPYTFMNEQMKIVFETLCPSKELVEKYNKSTIPIDVLAQVALCKQEGYFKKVEVWYDNRNPDPILVGYVTEEYSNSIMHIIARWGDEIVPYEQLVEKAIRRYTEAFKLSLQTLKSECEQSINNVDSIIRQYFAGSKSEWNIKPSFEFSIRSAPF